jgi:hypothetical protein
MKNLFMPVALALLLLRPAPSAELEVFASFEDAAELAAVQVSAGVQIRQSDKFPAWEENSLEVVFPAGGGFIETKKLPPDWRRQESLLLFVWSLQPGGIRLTVRDAAGGSATHEYRLRAGVNHLQWRLRELTALNRQEIRSLRMESSAPGTWYLDYFALDRYHPVLEQRGRWDIDYSMKEETPHIPWARPLSGGPIRVFAIADVIDGRGVIELAQRLEMSLRATTIGSSPGTNKWGFGDFYVQRSYGGEFWKHAYSLAHTYIADDLIYGAPCDVILWPGLVSWDSFPEEGREALRRRVEAGTGLVLFYPFNRDGKPSKTWNPSPLIQTPDIKSMDSNNFVRNSFEELDHSAWSPGVEHYITRGVPFSLFPWEQMAVPASKAVGEVLLRTAAGNPVLAVQTVGKGRVVAFAHAEKGMIPEIHNVFEPGRHYAYHEYLWSLVARATVWAARREPEPAIRDIICSPAGVEVRVDPRPEGTSLPVTVRNSFGEIEAQGTATYKTASRTFSLALPRLQGGKHIVELRLLDGKKVLDWSAAEFDSPVPVAIQSLKTETDRVHAGEEVPVRVHLSSLGMAAAEVHMRLFDNYDRLLDERRARVAMPAGADQAYRLTTRGALTHLARIDCEVLVDGVRTDRRVTEVFVLQPRRWDDYDIVMYRFGPDPIPGIWPKIDEQLRRLQVTTLSSYSLNNSKHANYNVQAQTRISGQESPDGEARDYYSAMKKKYLATGDKRALVREYCLSDPAYRGLVTKELKSRTEPWVPFSPMSYYVFEEPSLTCYGDALDLCFSPHTLRAMRTWLREVYGSIGQLNKQWGTAFPRWESVVPDDTAEAQKRGNYASWADHRTFMEITYADTFGFVLSELRKIDPEGILLNSGTQVSGSHNGCDYSRLNRYTKHLNAYDGGNQLDFHRNFSPDLKISGGSGYGVLGKDVFYNLYDGLFKGANGGAYIFWQYSTLDPDLTMSQSGKDMEEGLREMRGEGIGKLVGMAVPDNHGIAIHYSYPSIHGTWIVDGKVSQEVTDDTSRTFDRFNNNRDGWVKILKDSGLQFDFIAYSAVESGQLLSGNYKTLVLPMSVALSNREIDAIRQFVTAGGTLIADAFPGIMDEHCSFRAVRPLQDLFGVSAKPGTREALVRTDADPDLQAVGAMPLARKDERPLLLSHKFGKGRAYFLNRFLYEYPTQRAEGTAGPLLDQMAILLKDAGLHPKVTISGAGGERVPECATYLYNLGSTRLLGLVPDKNLAGEQKINLHFEGASAVYDVRRKEFLGTGTHFETSIEPAVPRLFAIVAEPVRGIEATAPPAANRGDEIAVGFSTLAGAGFRSVAKIEVFDPAGIRLPHYGRNQDLVDGRGKFTFRTALSDPRGIWKIAVTDVLSGRRAVVPIEVR